MNLAHRKQTFRTNWIAQSIFKDETLRGDRYREETPDDMDRLEQLMEDHCDLQQVRLFHWGRTIEDIAYGPSRPVPGSRRRTQQLISYGRRGCGNISRWMTTLPPAAFRQNEREPAEAYAITRLKVAPSSRETID